MIQYNLSPSLIARYFHHDCDRFLRYHATPENMRSTLGIPPSKQDTGLVNQMLLQTGLEWEETVVEQKIQGNVIIPPGDDHISNRSFSIEESLSLLSRISPDETIYQATIPITATFFKTYGLNTDQYRFSPCRPDLLCFHAEGNDEATLHVIDVKASEHLTISHRIQATLYSLILRETFREHKIDVPVNMDTAGIWLYGEDSPELFDQHLTIQYLDTFFRYRLPVIIETPLQDVSWHLTPRCERCEFYSICRREAENRNSLSLIPYLTREGKHHIEQQQTPDGTPVSTLADLDAFLSSESADNLLESCGSLRNKKDELAATVSALNEKRVVLHGGYSPSLPIGESIGIILTIQHEPVTKKTYAAGFRRFKGKNVFVTGIHENISIAKSPEECDEMRRDFIRSLYKELDQIHTYNSDLESWKDKQSLQTYVYDTYELELFNQLLQESIHDPAVQEMALQLLFYYQNPDIMNESRHPEKINEYPVIVLTNEIRRIAALPIPFTLRLPEVQKTIGNNRSEYFKPIEPNSLFWFEHNNRLKGNAILLAWNREKPEAITWIQWELTRRLSAANDVINGLRNCARSILTRWPPKFQFFYGINATHPEISRLIFITEYESFVGAQKTRELRIQPQKTRLFEGISIQVQYIQDNLWKLVNPLELSKYSRYQTFSYIIVPEGDNGEKAQMKFNDYHSRSNFKNPGNIGVSFAHINTELIDSAAGLLKGLSLEIYYNTTQREFEQGDIAFLHPRFTDSTSAKIIQRVEELDTCPDHDFITLLKDPQSLLVPPVGDGEDRRTALELSENVGFTRSQRQAFDHMVKNRLTLVWGPPGTGKTHFLAKAILCLVRARIQRGIPCRIGVAGFTHASIENLLVKIDEFAKELDCYLDLSIYKVKKVTTPKGENRLKVLNDRNVMSVKESTYSIFGGTIYGMAWLREFLLPCDVLVVDEASQMKPGELALGMTMLCEGGRLVLAGDNLQLPPIILGEYPTDDGNPPGLEDSVFAYLRGRDNPVNPKFTCQLQENWRMNQTLSSFAADALYGEAYQPATEKIRNQQICLREKSSNGVTEDTKEFLEWILDPSYPLTLCVIENVKAGIANKSEALMVALLTRELRERMCGSDGKRCYPDSNAGDYQFWRDGLFIVSPHHLQIEEIQNHLAQVRSWEYHPFVDTVDKMQGQEANAVIVSYGVSDIETAINEADFIYSLNRLNVSVTRARSKCIMFIPRPLMDPPIALLQNKKAADGLYYMLELQRFCRENGTARTFSLHFEPDEPPVQVMVLRAKISVDSPINMCSGGALTWDNPDHPSLQSVDPVITCPDDSIASDAITTKSPVDMIMDTDDDQMLHRIMFDKFKQEFMEMHGVDEMIESPDEVLDDDVLEEAFLLQEYLKELRSEQRQIEAMYKKLVERASTQRIEERGHYRLMHKVYKMRKIIPEQFYARYPELFVQIANIPVTRAEKMVGKDALNELVNTQESTRTTVEFLE